MKRPQVDFIIPSIENEDEGMVLHFTSVEEIDSVIESLEEARAGLEHQIEMYRQKRREKRKRAKAMKRNGCTSIDDKIKEIRNSLEEFDKLSDDEKINQILRDFGSLDYESQRLLKPIVDSLMELREMAKND